MRKLILIIAKVIQWANDWRPLAFRWLPDPYRLIDDCCDCENCNNRRAKGLQGARKY